MAVSGEGDVAAGDGAPDPKQSVAAALAVAESQHLVEDSRLQMMRGYAETQDCRRQYLLGYFGEFLDEPCGNCDTCSAGTAEEQPDADSSPFPLQSQVRHASWGTGLVMRYEGDRIVVLFEEVGYKTLSLDAVAKRGLLTAT